MVLDTESKNREKLKNISYESTRSVDFGDISKISGSKILDPLEQLHKNKQVGLHELTEVILHWVQEHLGIQELISARQDFFQMTGKVFPDDYFYHQRISYFLDFFTFQRPICLNSEDLHHYTPFNRFICSSFFDQENFSEHIQRKFYDLANFRHSLFKVIRIRKSGFTLKDIFSDENIDILDPSRKLLSQRMPLNALYQGFIFNLDNTIFLSQGLFLHPPSATQIITSTVNKLKKSPPLNQVEYLTKLAKLQLNHIRHPKLKTRQIYGQLKNEEQN